MQGELCNTILLDRHLYFIVIHGIYRVVAISTVAKVRACCICCTADRYNRCKNYFLKLLFILIITLTSSGLKITGSTNKNFLNCILKQDNKRLAFLKCVTLYSVATFYTQ